MTSWAWVLCALRSQGARPASGFVPHHLAVGSKGPEPWCPGPSMCHRLVFCAHLTPLRPHLPPTGPGPRLAPWGLSSTTHSPRPPAQSAATPGAWGPSSARRARRAESSRLLPDKELTSSKDNGPQETLCAPGPGGAANKAQGRVPGQAPWAAGSRLVGQAGAGLRASGPPSPRPVCCQDLRGPIHPAGRAGGSVRPACRRLHAEWSVAAPEASASNTPHPFPPAKSTRE